jgi:DNA polymerase-3 subunit epsilon
MTLLNEDVFVCIDVEATGLDPENDRIVEIAACKFTLNKIIDQFDTLIDPEIPIPEVSQNIHNISEDMVKNKPKIKEILPKLFEFANGHMIIGHGIRFDIAIIGNEAKRHSLYSPLSSVKLIDTLRLARLYGESPINSLESLRKHFNIEFEGAHRALNDVIVNIEVFKYLTKSFTTTKQLLQRLEKPVLLKNMPLGKHKGRPFSEIPLEYLKWAAGKDFDDDLLFSIRSEINARKKKINFQQASNPFKAL